MNGQIVHYSPSSFSNVDSFHIIDLDASIFFLKRALAFIEGLIKNNGRLFYIPSTIEKHNLIRVEDSNIEFRTTFFQNETFISSFLEKDSFFKFFLSDSKIQFSFLHPSSSSLSFDSSSTNIHQYSSESFLYPSNILRERIRYLNNSRHLFFSFPHALFLTNISENFTLIKEASSLGIPVIAIVNSHDNPIGIQYPIPGNNASISSITLLIQMIFFAISSGFKSQHKSFRTLNASQTHLQKKYL